MANRLKSTLIQNSSFQEAEMMLKLWGRFMRSQVYERSHLGSILHKLIMYRQNIRTGYYDYPEPTDERVLQVQRLFVFMPQETQCAAFLHYVLGGHKAFKAKRAGVSVSRFNSSVMQAREFVDQYKTVLFS